MRGAKRRMRTGLLIVVIILLMIRLFTGLIVIQPLGLVPDGMTIWYLRSGLDLPFISSPDGFSLERTGSVSLISRALSITTLLTAIEGKEIVRLPYSKLLYSISTGGKTFSK